MPAINADFSLPPIPSRRAQGLDAGQRGAMYVLASTPLRDFLQPLGITGYKAGLTGRRDVDERIKDLRLRRYASILAPLHDREQTIHNHPLANEWFLSRLPDPAVNAETSELMRQIPESHFVDGVIEFRIPPGVTVEALEKKFQRLLEPRNLNGFLASEDGRKRLAGVKLPENTRLFTDYTDLGKVRRSLACEIFLVRPQRELAVLLRALCVALEK